MTPGSELPLAGLKVAEFSHMVMGPAVGVILGDLGAEVIKIEPTGGDATRRLKGSGAGYFPMFNRNKQSICLDLKSPKGLEIASRLATEADIVIENFRPGAMDKIGLGYADLSAINSALIYCSAKGFLAGPYDHRTALDEVAQMMGGLAYMTGPPGRPLRAGASVIDITGGMFGVIGILAALEERRRTGKGQYVTCSLFETTAFMVGQHMAQLAVTGEAPNPMPVRISAWAIYDIFETADGQQVFLGVVSDSQWVVLCEAFGLTALGADPQLASNNNRVNARPEILPQVRAVLKTFSKAELLAKLENLGLPFAPIARPQDLFEDPHLLADGGLVEISLADGQKTMLPALPLGMRNGRFEVRTDVPAAGQQSDAVLQGLGFEPDEIESLRASNIVA
jgi:crotonobetainyl-CoA:carnitine CoA-transferase CaiB-like acyl-CoA transferase